MMMMEIFQDSINNIRGSLGTCNNLKICKDKVKIPVTD